MKCAICEERKPRRHCPGVQGEICPACCGEERENTVSCPLDCVYLREARTREKPNLAPVIPFSEIRVPDRFLDDHRAAFDLVLRALGAAVSATPEAVDFDIREAIEAFLRTMKTLQSGLVYESRPDNPVARNIYHHMQQKIEEGRKVVAQETGTSVRDSEIFTALLLLQRLEYRFNNGRKRGRAFIQQLGRFTPVGIANRPSPSLIV